MSCTNRKTILSLIIVVLVGALLTSFQTCTVKAQVPAGILRGDIIISRAEAKSAVPDDMNFWKPANPNLAYMHEPLWYLNVTNMQYVPMLASGLPVYTDNYTTMTVPLRSGVYWNDGVEFTADDVVYTVQLHMDVTGLTLSSTIQTWVQSIYKTDNYTVVFKLKQPNPKFHNLFTTFLGLNGLYMMPAHIWQTVTDPLTFTNNPKVDTGPYVVDSYDPNGYWCLFKRRDDWQRSATGIVLGEPKPLYYLRIYYAPDDPKMIIAISKHEMDITELTLELREVAVEANPYIQAFWKDYPYVWQNGICDHGLAFNNEKYPYNITDVRWALALAINITELNILALNGMGRIATFRSLSVPYIQTVYEPTLLPWIENFALSDGYKPFDNTIPQKLADFARSQGYTLAADPETIWGPGWWKYDPEESARLLQKNGFTRDTAGKWHLPNGDVWTIDLVIPAYHVLASRIGFGAAEQWRRFGVDITDEALQPGTFTPRLNFGDFDVIVLHGQSCCCCATVDVWQWWNNMHEKYYVPTGTSTNNNQIRWVNHEFSELIDQLSMLTTLDPRVISIVSELTKLTFEDMPMINCFLGSKMIVRDNYAWTNWPTGDNWYWEESHWNPCWMLPIFVNLEHTGNVPFTEEQAPVTPTIPKELEEAVMATAQNVANLGQAVSGLKSDLASMANQLEAINAAIASINMVTMVVAIEAVAIIILAIGLIWSLRRR